jgi:hypothetical protein
LPVATIEALNGRAHRCGNVRTRKDEEGWPFGDVTKRNENKPFLALLSNGLRQLSAKKEPSALLGLDLDREQPIRPLGTLDEQVRARRASQRERRDPTSVRELGRSV